MQVCLMYIQSFAYKRIFAWAYGLSERRLLIACLFVCDIRDNSRGAHFVLAATYTCDFQAKKYIHNGCIKVFLNQNTRYLHAELAA